MSGKSSIGCCLVLAAAAVGNAGCGASKKPIVVGSKEGTEQAILGELVAQHLEHRVDRKIMRNLNLGNTATVYQALLNGEIGLYPEETGTVQANILKETASVDAATTLERVRNEMRRIAQVEVLDPLGIDDARAIIIPTDKIETLSDAAGVQSGWKLGVTRDFNERVDGLRALNQYRLPMAAMTFVGDLRSLYENFESGKLTMVAGNMTDGWLARHQNWKALRDDKKVFGFYQTCVMVRADVLAGDPKIQAALAELSGKITTAEMQNLNAQVEIDRKKPAEVAAQFLAQAGLK